MLFVKLKERILESEVMEEEVTLWNVLLLLSQSSGYSGSLRGSTE